MTATLSLSTLSPSMGSMFHPEEEEEEEVPPEDDNDVHLT
jgi:hypothetical protein